MALRQDVERLGAAHRLLQRAQHSTACILVQHPPAKLRQHACRQQQDAFAALSSTECPSAVLASALPQLAVALQGMLRRAASI